MKKPVLILLVNVYIKMYPAIVKIARRRGSPSFQFEILRLGVRDNILGLVGEGGSVVQWEYRAARGPSPAKTPRVQCGMHK